MKRAGPVLCPVIVGRDEILERFDQLIAEAVLGHGHALFLAGPAGLGKTRLVRAVARKAVAGGLRVDGGSVAPQDLHVPLASIREMAVGLRNSTEFGTLSADLLAFDGRHGGDALGSRRLIVRGVADRILEAIDRPTLLVFDDLHWTDEMSLEVIGELARLCADKPLLLLGGYRPDEFPAGSIHREWRARLLSQRHAEEARLQPLTAEETAIATTLILGGELPAPRDVVAAVHERTNGIPLHIEELLGALDDNARTDGRRIREASVPDTIGDAVLARLARLSDEARLVARAGAVMGRCFSPDVMTGMVDRTLAELEPAIEELVDAAILHPFDYVDQGYYDFRHQLLRDAIYTTLPPAQLRRFHARAAEFGMSLEGASVIHASRHYERAGLRAQAYRTALTAAEEASRISARQEAFELYRRALDNMPPETPPAQQAEIHRAFAGAASAIERIDEMRTSALEARRLFLEAGRPADAAEMFVDAANADRRNGGSLEGRRALIAKGLAEIAALTPGPDTDRCRASLVNFDSLCAFDAADFDAATAHATTYLALAEGLGDPELVLDAQFLGAMIDLAAGRPGASIERMVGIAREARAAGYESVGVTSFRTAATMAARIMDYDAARSAIHEGIEYADAIEQSHCRQQMAATSAIIDWAHGAWESASTTAQRELVERGCRRGALSAMVALGFVALGRGEPEAVDRWLGEALANGREIGDIESILPPLWGLTEQDVVAGAVRGAAERAAEALAIAQATGERPFLVPFVVTGTRALLGDQRPDDAARWVEAARSHLGELPTAQPALAHAEGLIRMAGGSLVAAREAFERALRGWEERGRTWEAGWARLDLAQCLVRSNRLADAVAIMGEVRRFAEPLRAEPLLARVDELARTGRGRGMEDEPWRPLTVREFEVARLIAEGLTNGEIADRLDIAPKTASSHVEHILAKLGVTRRAEIAAWAASMGGTPRERIAPSPAVAPSAAVAPR